MNDNIQLHYKYATLNRKVIAFGIDTVIITLVFSPVFNLLMVAFFWGTKGSLFSEVEKNAEQIKSMSLLEWLNYLLGTVVNFKYILINTILLIFIIAYFVCFWVKIGASIGKLVMRCKVVDADTYKPITVKQAIKRILGHVLNILTLGIGLFMADFTKRNQGLHDKLANTIVVVRKK